jgi:hypothetical protein
VWAAANKLMAGAITAAGPSSVEQVITRRSSREASWLGGCSVLGTKENIMNTETQQQELQTIDSSELSSATGGKKASDVVTEVEQGINKALPSVENAATTIASLIDG